MSQMRSPLSTRVLHTLRLFNRMSLTHKPFRQSEAGPPKSELQIRANHITNESVASVHRMLTYAEESKDAGIRTIVELDNQGEQLEKIGENMDQIRADMTDAQKALRNMDKCCGIFILPWKKNKAFKDDQDAWKSEGDGKLVSSQPLRVMGSQPIISSGYIARIQKDDPREDEMEQGMVQLNSMVGNLKDMATDIRLELESQNRMMEIITTKGELNAITIADANNRASELLKKN